MVVITVIFKTGFDRMAGHPGLPSTVSVYLSCLNYQLVKLVKWKILCRVQLFVTPGLYSPWNSPGQNTRVGSLSLLQGIFPTQGSNPVLPHCRRILYQLSHKESPTILEWVTYPFSKGFSRPRNWTRVSCIAGGFFTNWAIREALVINNTLKIMLVWTIYFLWSQSGWQIPSLPGTSVCGLIKLLLSLMAALPEEWVWQLVSWVGKSSVYLSASLFKLGTRDTENRRTEMQWYRWSLLLISDTSVFFLLRRRKKMLVVYCFQERSLK